MSEQADIRTAFAALLATTLQIPVARFVPGTLRTDSGYLEAADPYFDFTGPAATFRRPALRLWLMLVSPSTDWERSMGWIDDKVALLRSVPVTTLVAGRQCPMIATVAPYGVLDVKALAFRVTFTPIQLGALT